MRGERLDRRSTPLWVAGAIALLGVLFVGAPPAFGQGSVARGEYIAKAAGCKGCHTNTESGGMPYAGGRALRTPFGTFYGPNLTPHPQQGLGRWTEQDFRRALLWGERPDGAHYFPAFPYSSYAAMTDDDVRDLWAYLRSLPAAANANRAHELRFPFGWRFLMRAWKWLHFTPGPFRADARANAAVNRGAYLVNVLGHCGECHTPRNFVGGPIASRHLAGAKLPEGRVANLTPTRLGKMSDAALADLLRTGNSPAGELAESMTEVVDNSTSQLTPADLAAMIAYLRSLPPRPDEK